MSFPNLLVFLSWSGERSRQMAVLLRSWLPDVLQNLDVWMSEEDIEKGAVWDADVAAKLQAARAGIVCVTPENQERPWLLFEAGALSNAVDDARVCTLAVGMNKGAIRPPLGRFQGTDLGASDMLRLVSTLNGLLGDARLSDPALQRAFGVWWPKLESDARAIAETPVDNAALAIRSQQEMLEEVVSIVRNVDRKLAAVTATVNLSALMTPDAFTNEPMEDSPFMLFVLRNMLLKAAGLDEQTGPSSPQDVRRAFNHLVGTTWNKIHSTRNSP